MKKLPLYTLLLAIMLFAGCSFSSGQKVGKLACSSDGYYDSLLLDKQVPFTRDEEKEAYVAEVPELCAKFTARSYNKSVPAEKWKTRVEKTAEVGLIIKNNRIATQTKFENSVGDIRRNHFVFYGKDKEQTLDDALQERFDIHHHFTPCSLKELEEGQAFPKAITRSPSSNSTAKSYYLESKYDLLNKDGAMETMENWKENYDIKDTFCGINYPFEWGTRCKREGNHLAPCSYGSEPNPLFYDENHPNRYMIYQQQTYSDPDDFLYKNLEIEFMD